MCPCASTHVALFGRLEAHALRYLQGTRYGYVAQDEADRVVLEQPDVWVGGEHGAGARAGAYGLVGARCISMSLVSLLMADHGLC